MFRKAVLQRKAHPVFSVHSMWVAGFQIWRLQSRRSGPCPASRPFQALRRDSQHWRFASSLFPADSLKGEDCTGAPPSGSHGTKKLVMSPWGVSLVSPSALGHARQEAANSALASSSVTAKPLKRTETAYSRSEYAGDPPRTCQAMWGRETRPPASPAAARAPQEATQPPRRREACQLASSSIDHHGIPNSRIHVILPQNRWPASMGPDLRLSVSGRSNFGAFATMLSRTLPAGFIAPCLPNKAPRPLSGALWLHET
jgi:hypothetical protein